MYVFEMLSCIFFHHLECFPYKLKICFLHWLTILFLTDCSRDRSTGNTYYFNYRTSESTWDHPCDQFYRNLLSEERKKKNKTSAGKKSSKKVAHVRKAAGWRPTAAPEQVSSCFRHIANLISQFIVANISF